MAEFRAGLHWQAYGFGLRLKATLQTSNRSVSQGLTGFPSGLSCAGLLTSFSVIEATLFWPCSLLVPSFSFSSSCLMFRSMSAYLAVKTGFSNVLRVSKKLTFSALLSVQVLLLHLGLSRPELLFTPTRHSLFVRVQGGRFAYFVLQDLLFDLLDVPVGGFCNGNFPLHINEVD